MKQLIGFSLSLLVILIAACGEKVNNAPRVACSSDCLKDSIIVKGDHAMEPVVYISAKDCSPEDVGWKHKGWSDYRKMPITHLTQQLVTLDKSAVKIYIKDTSHAWLMFNDCKTTRGYAFKLPFDPKGNLDRSNLAINNIDRRYSIADGLVCMKKGNTIVVVDMDNGKQESVSIKPDEINNDNMYDIIDSVNITRSRIYLGIKKDGKASPIEKNISL